MTYSAERSNLLAGGGSSIRSWRLCDHDAKQPAAPCFWESRKQLLHGLLRCLFDAQTAQSEMNNDVQGKMPALAGFRLAANLCFLLSATHFDGLRYSSSIMLCWKSKDLRQDFIASTAHLRHRGQQLLRGQRLVGRQQEKLEAAHGVVDYDGKAYRGCLPLPPAGRRFTRSSAHFSLSLPM